MPFILINLSNVIIPEFIQSTQSMFNFQPLYMLTSHCPWRVVLRRLCRVVSDCLGAAPLKARAEPQGTEWNGGILYVLLSC